jgi:Ca2+-binding EF-hand superfamily protein
MSATRVVLVCMTVCFAWAEGSLAQKQMASKPDKSALATQNVKQLLLLMDTDKNGKISKQEWMKFMAAEFDRLDTDKSGELDPKELMQSRLSVRRFQPSSQGK